MTGTLGFNFSSVSTAGTDERRLAGFPDAEEGVWVQARDLGPIKASKSLISSNCRSHGNSGSCVQQSNLHVHLTPSCTLKLSLTPAERGNIGDSNACRSLHAHLVPDWSARVWLPLQVRGADFVMEGIVDH